MAQTLPQTLNAQFSGLSRLAAHRQFGVILGLAVVAALAVGAVFWALQPRYVELLPAEAQRDFGQARRLLDRADIQYRLDSRTRALMVPDRQVAEAESALMEGGLLGNAGEGYEILDGDSSFGKSRLQESSLQVRALQGEIARAIMTINGVASAKVMLAIPSESAFARERQGAKASVTLNLRGHQLSDGEIAAIVHTVASSVPNLDPSQVSVIDERARLLNQPGSDPTAVLRSQQLDYVHRVEDGYRKRVEDILAPVVGRDGMRVQVTANIDFTQVETASETYGADEPVVVSEALREDQSSLGPGGGVPGALTNQPPAAGVVADAAAGLAAGTETAASGPQSTSRSSTRNFQNDREVSHVRRASPSLRSLSISVVVDHRAEKTDSGELTRVERTPEEIARLESLVRDAVGFSAERGDSLTVLNQAFLQPGALATPPPLPIWQQPWVWALGRYLAAGLGVLLLVVLVIRPVLKSLASLPPPASARPASPAGLAELGGPDAAAVEVIQARQSAAAATDAALERARKVAEEDPRLVAQVVRRWIDADAK